MTCDTLIGRTLAGADIRCLLATGHAALGSDHVAHVRISSEPDGLVLAKGDRVTVDGVTRTIDRIVPSEDGFDLTIEWEPEP